MTELFSSLAAYDHALIVRRPLQVLDAARQRLKFIFEYMFLVDRVPNAHLARLIGRGYVEARRRILGHLNRLRVLRVHVTLERIVHISYEHTIAIHIDEIFTLRIGAQLTKRAPGRTWQRCEYIHLFYRRSQNTQN